MRKTLLIVGCLLVLCSCRTQKPIETHSLNSVIIEKQLDTVVYTKPDSSSIMALIKCDSLGKAYLSEILKLQLGKHTQSIVVLKKDTLTVHCNVDSMGVYLSMSSKLRTRDSTVTSLPISRTKSNITQILNALFKVLVACIILFGIIYFSKKRHGYK